MSSNPFESPQTFEPVGSRSGLPAWVKPYASADTRGLIAMITVGLASLLAATRGVLMLNQAVLLGRVLAGGAITQEEAQRNNLMVKLVNYSWKGVFLLAAIAMLCWVHRAYRNLPALRATGLELTPGSAVGWWFVPIANLVQPFLILKEIWLASNPEMVGNVEWRRGPSTMRIGIWWVCWLGANLIAVFMMTTYTKGPAGPPDYTGLRTVSYLTAVSSALAVVAGMLLTSLIRDINRRQEHAHVAAQNFDLADAGSAAI